MQVLLVVMALVVKEKLNIKGWFNDKEVTSRPIVHHITAVVIMNRNAGNKLF